MNEDFFEELHKLSRDNEWRHKLLIRGAKKMLEERKKQSPIKRWLQRRKKAEPGSWK